MVEENNKKTNFFKEVFKSIKDLEKYEDFAIEQPKKAFKYILKLSLIFTLLITLFYSYKIVENLNNIYTNLKDRIPEFSYSNGKLTTDSSETTIIKELEDAIGKIIIDTTVKENETEKYEEEIKNSNSSILILEDKFIILTQGGKGQVSYKYEDVLNEYGIDNFTKQDAINYLDGLNIISIYTSIYFVMFVYFFIIYLISILLDVLILSALAYIIGIISKIKFKFASAFNIAVHSITLPLLLNLIYIIVNLLTGFNIKYFGIMYSTISYIYVIVAILMIKTDFINRQIELIKLAQEQEKVREELQRQREEQEKEKKKEEENKEKPNKEQDNKSKKKKQKEDEGELEGGVNPSVIQENE